MAQPLSVGALVIRTLSQLYNKPIILLSEIYFYFGEGEYVKKIFKMSECINNYQLKKVF